MSKKKVLSLFSGCGGMDLGFEGNFEVIKSCVNTFLHPDWIQYQNSHKVLLSETMFETVFANDILKSAQAAWIPYFLKRGKSYDAFVTDSIVDLVKSHKEGKFKFPMDVDIVTGGFPCQDFSVAGKRKGFDSEKNHLGERHTNGEDAPSVENRGQLYLWMKEVVSITKPKVFIAENVKGLVSLGNVREIIERDFREIDQKGYLVIPSKVLNAPDYGVPQSRQRIIFIGFNKRYLKKEAQEKLLMSPIPFEYDPYPPITHCKKGSEFSLDFKDQKLLPYVTVREALANLKEPECEEQDLAQKSYSKAKFLYKLQGNSEVNLDGVGPTIRAEHHGNIEYRRLSLENGGKIHEELNQGLPERRLTVRECARIQTFPDDYEFVRTAPKGSFPLAPSAAYKVIGNAVPPFLAYSIAKKLESIWFNLFDE